MNWKRHSNGSGWLHLSDGRIRLEGGASRVSDDLRRYVETDPDGAIRTKGEPTSMELLRDEYGPQIEAASIMMKVAQARIAGMLAIEAQRIPGTLSFDPISLRDEDYAAGDVGRPFERYRERPHRVSAGLMQTLLSTARQMNSKHGLFGDLDICAAYGPDGTLDIPDLCVPERSILLGAAYMRHQMEKIGDDPILLVGAYNAGGVYETSSNPWRIRTYGVDRIPKFAAYHNDWLALETP